MVLVTCHAYMSSVEKKYLMIVMIVMAKHKTNVKKVNRMKNVVLGFFSSNNSNCNILSECFPEFNAKGLTYHLYLLEDRLKQ